MSPRWSTICVTVDTASDTADGVTTSIDALLANKGADGFISLREAIIAANNTGGLDTIRFNIGGGGLQTISLLSALPTISGAVVIDGSTQGGFAGVPLIELKGNGLNADGLALQGGGSTVRGLIINGFDQYGISLTGAGGNVIQGNYIGTNAAGTAAVLNKNGGIEIRTANNLIGGTSAADRNVISGNGSGDVPGIVVRTPSAIGNVIQGNYIGLNAAGTAGIANSGSGIDIYGGAGGTIIGGTVAGAGNVISGNDTGSDGIWISGGSGNVIQGNLMGTDAAGVAAVPNDYSGIYITSSTDNLIGGTAAGAGNVIAYASNSGVIVIGNSSVRNAILGNSIHGNGLLGIDLREDGVSINDGIKESRPNESMDSPVFTLTSLAGSTLTLAGYVGSAAGQSVFAGARVEVFVADDDASGFGEGRTYLGFLTTDASGNFSGDLTVSGVNVGHKLTATATDAAGNTSEFGANRVALGAGNVAPSATNLSAGQTYTEDTPLALTPIVVSDADSAERHRDADAVGAGCGQLEYRHCRRGDLDLQRRHRRVGRERRDRRCEHPAGSADLHADDQLQRQLHIATSVSDGAAAPVTGTKAFTGVAVNDPPVITSNGGAANANVSVPENTSAVTTVTATDVEGSPLVYSILPGADAARFAIDGSTGVLRFIVPPNFEAPTDAGGNNVYDVTVRASDGSLTASQAIAVTVTQRDRSPATTGEQRVNTIAAGTQETSSGRSRQPARRGDVAGRRLCRGLVEPEPGRQRLGRLRPALRQDRHDGRRRVRRQPGDRRRPGLGDGGDRRQRPLRRLVDQHRPGRHRAKRLCPPVQRRRQQQRRRVPRQHHQYRQPVQQHGGDGCQWQLRRRLAGRGPRGHRRHLRAALQRRRQRRKTRPSSASIPTCCDRITTPACR